MARSSRQVPNIYFGRPGSLVTLPWPLGGITKPYARQSFDFLTGSGNHAVSTLTAGSRSYALTWNVLHADSYLKLEQFWNGSAGPGPFALVDPSAMNLLPANVAAATSVNVDTTDLLTFTNGGSASSNANASFIHRSGGYRSIRWLFTESNPGTLITFPVLYVRPQFRSWFGVPVMVGLPYTFSSWVRVDGTIETSASLNMKLEWFDAMGGSLGFVQSSTATVTSAWQQVSVTATAPASAAYVMPSWVGTAATLATGGSFYIDEPLLEQDSVVNGWAPGAGVKPVAVMGLDDEVPWEAHFRTGVTMNLQELAR